MDSPLLGLIVSLATVALAAAGEVYFAGFEDPPFKVGDDKIINTDGWVGSHAGNKLHGISSEDQHGVLGIGNAAYIGGYATLVFSTNKTINVRRPVSLDPVALGQEVLNFSVVAGIKDSTSASLIGTRYKRDNFEIVIYNQAGTQLAGLQFDNTTLDSTSGLPRRLLYRLSAKATGGYQYVLLPYNFLPETLEPLQFRINFRTNRWTATLSGVPLFEDIEFFAGTAARNFGFAAVQMQVTTSTASTISPGDNYLLFDDYAVRTDPVTTTLAVSRGGTGAAQLAWNEEAGYRYQVEYSGDCVTWKSDLAGSGHTATLTGTATFTDPTVPVPVNRFYRIQRSYP